MKSPPKSPDLNPIEKVWNEMKIYLRQKGVSTIQDAKRAIVEFQKLLTPLKCQSYIGNLKKVYIIKLNKQIIYKNVLFYMSLTP